MPSHLKPATSYSETARACVNGEEPIETLLHLLTNPDQQVRIATIRALGAEYKKDFPDAHATFTAMWKALDDAQMQCVIAALLETLELDTRENKFSYTACMLYTTETSTDEIAQALAWSSTNYASPKVRVWSINTALLFAPGTNMATGIIQQGLRDPDPHVRRKALRAWAINAVTALSSK